MTALQDKVSRVISSGDGRQMTDLMDYYWNTVSVETKQRLRYLVNDRLINAQEFATLIENKNVDELDKMILRIEKIDIPKIRNSRMINPLGFDDLQKTWDLKSAGLDFVDIEHLEELINSGYIDVDEFQELLGDGNTFSIEEFVIDKWKQFNFDNDHKNGRKMETNY